MYQDYLYSQYTTMRIFQYVIHEKPHLTGINTIRRKRCQRRQDAKVNRSIEKKTEFEEVNSIYICKCVKAPAMNKKYLTI